MKNSDIPDAAFIAYLADEVEHLPGIALFGCSFSFDKILIIIAFTRFVFMIIIIKKAYYALLYIKLFRIKNHVKAHRKCNLFVILNNLQKEILCKFNQPQNKLYNENGSADKTSALPFSIRLFIYRGSIYFVKLMPDNRL